MVTNVPHMGSDHLTPAFLEQLCRSLGLHSTCPCLVVGIAMRDGCIELILDLVPLLPEGVPHKDSGSTHHVMLDPVTWLQHLQGPPPVGTQVLSQSANGRCVTRKHKMIADTAQR